MHATVGTRPAFELLSHGELAVSALRVRTIYPRGKKTREKDLQGETLRMKEGERDNNICYVREEKEREKEGTDIRRE